MDLLFKNILQKQYYFLDFITLLLLLLITSFSILEDLKVIAQEDLDILVNEEEVISETGKDTTTDEGNQQEDKPIKLDTISSSSEVESQLLE